MPGRSKRKTRPAGKRERAANHPAPQTRRSQAAVSASDVPSPGSVRGSPFPRAPGEEPAPARGALPPGDPAGPSSRRDARSRTPRRSIRFAERRPRRPGAEPSRTTRGSARARSARAGRARPRRFRAAASCAPTPERRRIRGRRRRRIRRGGGARAPPMPCVRESGFSARAPKGGCAREGARRGRARPEPR